MLSIVIDDQRLQCQSGQTVLQVARDHGIDIPSLCHHPGIPDVGACRVCLVEVAGPRGRTSLMAACTLPVTQDMQVRTETEAVQRCRRTIVELILARAPESETVRTLAARCGCGREPLRREQPCPQLRSLRPLCEGLREPVGGGGNHLRRTHQPTHDLGCLPQGLTVVRGVRSLRRGLPDRGHASRRQGRRAPDLERRVADQRTTARALRGLRRTLCHEGGAGSGPRATERVPRGSLSRLRAQAQGALDGLVGAV